MITGQPVIDTVQNLGVVRPFAETGGGPNVRPRHGPG
jgi:hypothetical protein